MVEHTHPEHIWAYDDGADVMAFDWDNASGGAVKYVRADVAERQLSEAVERAVKAERQGEDQWAGWVKADCRARAAEAEVARLTASRDGYVKAEQARADEQYRLAAEVARLREALKPFADIAGEAWADENGWTDAACQNDRVCDWFGPSAFRTARAALQGEPKP
nr:MAG TPA: hypothetical protein [Caudoviricetes sp.]